MTIADRIQKLRKLKGISQEELADELGVSRQAVSKWESNQSTPDIDKIIALSDFFEVSADYLLKGENDVNSKSKSMDTMLFSSNIFYITGTASNIIGLIAGLAVWKIWQNAFAFLVGSVFMIYGFMAMFFAEYMIKLSAPKFFQIVRKKTYKYIMINNWLWLLGPVYLLSSFIFSLINISTGIAINQGIAYICTIAAYIIICIVISFILAKKCKEN